MPPESSFSFTVTRATTKKPWWTSNLSLPEGTYDLSDHHPCEFQFGKLKGVSYNIQCLPRVIAPTIGKQKSADLQAYAQELTDWLTRQDADYDVICVQELWDEIATSAIEQAMTAKGYTVHSAVGGNKITGMATTAGVRIFTRNSLTTEEGKSHIYRNKVDYLKGGDALTDKGIKHVVVTKDNVRYHILDTHLQASYNDPSQQYYVEVALAQLLELKTYVQAQRLSGVIKDTDQVVLCGDFNIPKDAHGTNLDAVSSRGEAFFDRAQRLLGPGFQLLPQTQASETQPKCTFDPKTNTYLDGTLGNKKETMSANLDLVFTVNPNSAPASDLLFDELLSHLQVHLSRIVRDNIRMLSLKGLYQLSEEDKVRIEKLSIAMDDLAKGLRSESFSSKSMKDAINQILKFSEGLLLRDQIDIERLVTGMMLAGKALPAEQQQVKLALENSADHILDPRAINCVRGKWKQFRADTLLNDQSVSLNNVNRILLDKKEIQPFVASEIARLENKGQQLKRFHPEVTAAMSTLSKSLGALSAKFFSNETNRNEYLSGCEKAFSEVEALLQQHRGVKRWLGSFLIGVGQLLGFPSWIKKGGEYHASETDSMHHLHRFKSLANSVGTDESPSPKSPSY